MVCSVKQAHYLLSGSDKVEESSRWKHKVLIEIENVAKNTWTSHLTCEDHRVSSTFEMVSRRF